MASQLIWLKRLVLVCFSTIIVACAPTGEVDKLPEPLGDFKLGHTIVVANQVKRGPLSRKASQEMLVNAVKPELQQLFGQYSGPKFYNIAVSIDAYVLAIPGVPVVASPKSTLIMGLTVWDDAAQTKLMSPPEQIIVLEDFSAKTIFGSGLTQDKEEQLALLAKAAAREIQRWMVENKHLFEPAEDTEAAVKLP